MISTGHEPAKTMLDDLRSLATLEDLAGTTAFRHGEEYFSVGKFRYAEV